MRNCLNGEGGGGGQSAYGYIPKLGGRGGVAVHLQLLSMTQHVICRSLSSGRGKGGGGGGGISYAMGGPPPQGYAGSGAGAQPPPHPPRTYSFYKDINMRYHLIAC